MPEVDKQNVAPAEGGGEPKKTGATTYITAIVVPMILAVALIYFLVYPWYRDTYLGTQARQEETPEVKEEKPIGQLYTISGLTVNPSDSNGRRFAVFEVVMEYEDPEITPQIKNYEPVIKDRFLRYFRERTVNELASIATMDSSKHVLTGIANNVLGKPVISNIYFTQFVLQ